jgi:GH24 family phage-related lysozyme (muramidase)
MSVSKRAALFDTIRRMLTRGFRQSEVDAIDDALDSLGTGPGTSPREVSVPRIRRHHTRRIGCIGPEGTSLIKRFEGCARLRRDGLVEAYPDPGTGAEPWTIGWGATGEGLEEGSRIGPGTVWTQAQCDARLARDLERYAREVAEAIGEAPTTQGQFDAMVSFHYNTGAIARATLTRKHCNGDHEGAANEFRRWNKAAGRVLAGLVRRRQEEERLYRKG